MKNRNVLLIGLLGFLLMLIFLHCNLVENIDIYSEGIQSLFSANYLKTFFFIITNIMSFVGILFILIITTYLLKTNNDKKIILLYIISILSCLAVTNIIKILIKRERPLELLLYVTGYSFPSGHSSISMVVYGYLILLLRRYYNGKRKKLYIGICLLLIFLTGLSRVIFNVHYITDVIAGFSIGLIVLSISNHYLKKLTN